MSTRKTLVFIRHAESEGNVAYENGTLHASPRDASLSANGWQQAEEAVSILAARLAAADAITNDGLGNGWLLASSPLTRALQTAERIWPPKVPVGRRAVAPELREFLIDRDDIGTPRSKLEEVWPSLRQAFQEAGLAEVWWSVPQGTEAQPPEHATPGVDGYERCPDGKMRIVDQAHVDARVDSAIEWLARQPEAKVAVVAHGALLGMVTAKLGLGWWGFPNCGVLLANDVDLSPK